MAAIDDRKKMRPPFYYSFRRGVRGAVHYALPHEAKRNIFKLLFPIGYNRLRRLRSSTGQWSYKPFGYDFESILYRQ